MRKRLPDARPGSQDDQVRLLQAAGQLVEVAIAGRDAEQVALVLVDEVDALEIALEHLRDRLVVVNLVRLRDIEDGLLGLVEDIVQVARLVVAERHHLGAGADEPAAGGAIGDRVGVVLGMDGGRDGVERARTGR